MKHLLFKLSFYLLLLTTFGCTQKDTSTQIFWRKDLREDDYIYYNTDHIIIANPPKDSVALKLLIDNFNDTTDILGNMDRKPMYTRIFYKESREMPRDFQSIDNDDWFGLGKNCLDCRGNDILFRYKWEILSKLVENRRLFDNRDRLRLTIRNRYGDFVSKEVIYAPH